MSDSPIRVLVWGPGGLGKAAIRQIAERTDFQLVGVLAHSPEKDGIDAGALAGIDRRLDVAATTSLERALSVNADVVLHVTRDFGRYGDVPLIERFLRAGRNVVSVHPYHHPEAMAWTSAPDDVVMAITAAGEAGGATFTATGIHPEWIADRMAPALSGICADIRHALMYENWDMSHYDNKTLSVLGFGKDPSVMESSPALAQMTDNYCLQNLYGLAASLGIELDRIVRTHEYATAPTDLTFWSLSIPAGTVGRLTHTWHGYRQDEQSPAVTAEVNWMLGRDHMVPVQYDPTHYYGVRIEGTPSVAMGISILDSLDNDGPRPITNDPSSEPGYTAIIAACLQAMPRTIASPPGWLQPVRPAVHWAPDFRRQNAVPLHSAIRPGRV